MFQHFIIRNVSGKFQNSINLLWKSKTVFPRRSKSTVGEWKVLQRDQTKQSESFLIVEFGRHAIRLEERLKQGASKPFPDVIKANIGDCHATGQKPMTYIRQVLALCMMPDLAKSGLFPSDAVAKAEKILSGCGGHSIGSYSDSKGVDLIRKDVAGYISRRDGQPASGDNIFMSTGASEIIRTMIEMLAFGEGKNRTGIMIPIPQYPLYSACIAEMGVIPVGYYLDEDNGWGIDVAEMKRSIEEAKATCAPRAIVIINPGNPTGQVLSRQNIEDVIKFAYDEKLFLMADEVYQDNIYAEGAQFHSFKKVTCEMGEPWNKMELASFHSMSKGFMGECGLRGGYGEILNLGDGVKTMIEKLTSSRLCCAVTGQAAMSIVCDPPKPGDPSYELFQTEKNNVLKSLHVKAELVADAFNAIPGIKCNTVMGAMYAFPQLLLPNKAIEAAKAKGMEPDSFYAFDLLENTGICVVPGSGFKQKENTYHFRTTILPPTEKMKEFVKRFTQFHNNFMNTYKD